MMMMMTMTSRSCGCWARFVATAILCFGLLAGSRSFTVLALEEEEEEIDVVIELSKRDDGVNPHREYLTLSAAHKGRIHTELHRTHAVAMTIPKSELGSLEAEKHVKKVELNNLVYPAVAGNGAAGETPGYGFGLIDMDDAGIPPASSQQQSSNGGGNCFKVCVVDGGVLLDHPEIPFTKGDSNVQGTEFNIPSGQQWDRPIYNHGTHVTGIMMAEANNNIGIRGIIGDNSNICLLVARVFDDEGNGQYDSEVLAAAEWCADMGARVINMSLGSTVSGTEAARQVYETITAEGALVVAASGNYGNTEKNYPASFDTVMSVAAIDQFKQKADFSNYNDEVNIAAPGASIYSTVSDTAVVDDAGTRHEARVMEYSQKPNVRITGMIKNCGDAESDFSCQGATNKICLIRRGGDPFAVKAKRCQDAGGKGAIIFNHEEGSFTGTLSDEDIVTIPVVGVAQAIGMSLLQSKKATISLVEPGYKENSGTSMAVPFVAGIAARIWSVRPECTNEQIRNALYNSAENIGDSSYFGHGLVQAKKAYDELLQSEQYPCGDVGAPTQSDTATQTNSWWWWPSNGSGNGSATTIFTTKKETSWWHGGRRNLRGRDKGIQKEAEEEQPPCAS